MLKRLLLPLLLVLTFSTACTDDETPLPAFRQDFGELFTDADSVGRSVRLDNGTTLKLKESVATSKPDTTLRVLLLHIIDGEQTSVRGISLVPCFEAKSYAETAIHTDPVDLVSAAISGRYLNLELGVKSSTSNVAHRFGFHIVEADNAARTIRLLLVHDQASDPAYFTKEWTLSCPIAHFKDEGYDAVEITVNTFRGKTVQRLTL